MPTLNIIWMTTPLGSPASERFDRLAQLALLSKTVFEARGAAED